MRQKLTLSIFFLLLGLTSLSVYAQTAAVKPSVISGDVVSIAEGKLVLQTKDGALEASLSDKTQYFRVPPDNLSPKAATPAAFADINAGDKVLVTGILAEDKKSLPARSVYLVSKTDLAQRQAKEQEDWRVRGIVGRVVNFNPQTSVITVTVRGMMGERTIAVSPKERAEFYRYAPDSIEFKDAKRGTIADIDAGDEIRVLGDRSADGATMQAEKVITGGFNQIVGTVKSVDAAKNEVVIGQLGTSQDVTIVLGDSSVLKQIPAEMAQRLAQMQAMQAAGGQGGLRPPMQGGGQQPNAPTQGQQPNAPQGQNPPNRQGGFGGRGGEDLVDRFPNIKITDIKAGEMIGVLTSKTKDAGRIRAFKLVAGVEPFVRLAQARQQGAGGNRGGGVNSNFQIPGLDGFGTP